MASPSLAGRTCLVTGASSGIGRVTALELARMGARVIAVSRDRARGEAAVADIRSATGGRIDLFVADLSSQPELRRMAAAVRDRYDRLHLLVNNAGTVRMTRELTADGIEYTFAVNHLAYFLLTNLLLDLLTRSAPARIVNVASEAHRMTTLDFKDLDGGRNYKGGRAYALSKLCNVLFSYELARRLEGTGVSVNAVHPGGVATNIWSHGPWWLRPIIAGMRPFLLSSEQGAATVLRLATASDLEGVTGRYYDRMKETRSAPQSYDTRVAEGLWITSEEMTGMRSRSGGEALGPRP